MTKRTDLACQSLTQRRLGQPQTGNLPKRPGVCIQSAKNQGPIGLASHTRSTPFTHFALPKGFLSFLPRTKPLHAQTVASDLLPSHCIGRRSPDKIPSSATSMYYAVIINGTLQDMLFVPPARWSRGRVLLQCSNARHWNRGSAIRLKAQLASALKAFLPAISLTHLRCSTKPLREVS